jgi:2-methylcitrate dehydratase PrpD
MAQNSSPSLAQALVESLDSISAGDLPASTVDAVRRSSLQILGVARLGTANDIARNGIDYVVASEGGTAATVVTRGRRGTAAGAAFANSLASHADFREDTHAESQSHPGVVVIPAVLAAAEATGKPLPSGRYIEAVVAGHELIGRLGEAAAIKSTERGFRAPSVITLFGATLAVSVALGLSKSQRVHALAIAGQGASGVNQPFNEGTDDWFLAPAFAARQAVMSALLAAAGVEGSPHILDGEDGILGAFAGDRDIVVDTSLPGTERIHEIEHTRLKGALTCGWNQSLVYQLSQATIPVDRVKKIDVRLSRGAAEYPGVSDSGPYATRTAALLSSSFATALQLVRGGLGQSGYQDLNAPDLAEVARLVSVAPDDRLVGYATEIDIELDGGETLHLADGNDSPGFSLDTVDKVVETLRRNYRSDGQDPARVDELVVGVDALMDSGDTAAISAALS